MCVGPTVDYGYGPAYILAISSPHSASIISITAPCREASWRMPPTRSAVIPFDPDLAAHLPDQVLEVAVGLFTSAGGSEECSNHHDRRPEADPRWYRQRAPSHQCLVTTRWGRLRTRGAPSEPRTTANWHLAPGTWHLAPGTWHLAPGTWHLAY